MSDQASNRPARLPVGAYEAIYAEHQRDHDNGPGEPRAGCPGCALLAEVGALRAVAAEACGILVCACGALADVDKVYGPGGKRAATKLGILVLAVDDAMAVLGGDK